MKNYFSGHKSFFQQISHDKRNNYLSQMLEKPHQIGTPYNFAEAYPHEDQFDFQNYKIHYYHTKEVEKPKALVFYLHGLYSCGGVYAYFGNKVVQEIDDICFYAIDFLNFGKSVGDYRGYIESFQFIVSQAEAFVKHITDKYEKKNIKPKLFLLGHSFGGTIAFKVNLNNPNKFSGVIFLVPALRQIKFSQYYLKKIGKFIGYLFPKLKLTSQTHTDFRYANQPDYKYNDLIYNGRNIPGTIRVVLNAIEEIQHKYEEFQTPYILFQAGVDKLVDIFAPLDFQKKSKSKDKTTVYIKDMWHAIFYEKQIEQIVEMSTQWLKQRI